MVSNQDPSCRTALTGWLHKRKSESAKSRFLKSANKRFFTLDFQGQIFYYSHTEAKKNISMTLFKDILSVEPIAATSADLEENQTVELTSSASMVTHGPSLRKMASISGLSKKTTEQPGFVVKTSGKYMELLCSSRTEAEMWITALHEAIAMGRTISGGDNSTEIPNSELSTTPGSSLNTSPRSNYGPAQSAPGDSLRMIADHSDLVASASVVDA